MFKIKIYRGHCQFIIEKIKKFVYESSKEWLLDKNANSHSCLKLSNKK